MAFFHLEPLFVAGGSYIGLATGYFIEKKYVRYKVNAPALIQVTKVVLGLVVAIGLKEGLKLVFPYSASVDINPTFLDLSFDFLRYFLIGVWASLGMMWVSKKLFKRTK